MQSLVGIALVWFYKLVVTRVDAQNYEDEEDNFKQT